MISPDIVHGWSGGHVSPVRRYTRRIVRCNHDEHALGFALTGRGLVPCCVGCGAALVYEAATAKERS